MAFTPTIRQPSHVYPYFSKLCVISIFVSQEGDEDGFETSSHLSNWPALIAAVAIMMNRLALRFISSPVADA